MTETTAPYARQYTAIDDFIRRWAASGAAERANYQLFLSELCDQLEVARPDPTRPDDKDNAYVFERTVTFRHGDGSASAGRIDLYKRGCFVLEAKQGSDRHAADPLVRETSGHRRKGTAVRGTSGWDDAMLAARGQAEQYARALPVEEGWPPFLVVVDVGHSIELYSEFSCTGAELAVEGPDLGHRLGKPPLPGEGDGGGQHRLPVGAQRLDVPRKDNPAVKGVEPGKAMPIPYTNACGACHDVENL